LKRSDSSLSRRHHIRKVNGPAWLTVAANGALSGTPSATSGVHEFVVTATDSKGMATYAALNIQLDQSNFAGAAAQQLGTPVLETNDRDGPALASLAGAAELMASDREFADMLWTDRRLLTAKASAAHGPTQAVIAERDEIEFLLAARCRSDSGRTWP
jgi:hypothetical protein